MEKYKQCKLKRCDQYTVGYIPDFAAHLGNKIELLEMNGDFYEVIEVSEHSVDKEFVRSQERNFKSFQGSIKGGGIDQ